MMRELIARHVEPLQARVRSLLLRGLVRMVTESTGLRALQFTTRTGDPPDDAEQWEPLGLTARPLVEGQAPPGAEVRGLPELLVARLGGAADNAVVLAVADRARRPTDTDHGEVGLYDCGPGLLDPATHAPLYSQQRIRLRPGTGIAIVAPYGVSIAGATVVTGALSGTTVRSGDGLSGTIAFADGETLTVQGGIITGAGGTAVFTPAP